MRTPVLSVQTYPISAVYCRRVWRDGSPRSLTTLPGRPARPPPARVHTPPAVPSCGVDYCHGWLHTFWTPRTLMSDRPLNGGVTGARVAGNCVCMSCWACARIGPLPCSYRVGPVRPASKSRVTPRASASRVAVSRVTVRCRFPSSTEIMGCATRARFASSL
jgi:hypothetical protein